VLACLAPAVRDPVARAYRMESQRPDSFLEHSNVWQHKVMAVGRAWYGLTIVAAQGTDRRRSSLIPTAAHRKWARMASILDCLSLLV
jgi:hypothetical protein